MAGFRGPWAYDHRLGLVPRVDSLRWTARHSSQRGAADLSMGFERPPQGLGEAEARTACTVPWTAFFAWAARSLSRSLTVLLWFCLRNLSAAWGRERSEEVMQGSRASGEARGGVQFVTPHSQGRWPHLCCLGRHGNTIALGVRTACGAHGVSVIFHSPVRVGSGRRDTRTRTLLSSVCDGPVRGSIASEPP